MAKGIDGHVLAKARRRSYATEYSLVAYAATLRSVDLNTIMKHSFNTYVFHQERVALVMGQCYETF